MILALDRVVRFVAVAELCSITRAADYLRIDQPWLSRQIIQLEEQLGVPLFMRTGGKMRLTEEGKEFYAHAKPLADAAQKAQLKADEMKHRGDAVLHIGVSSPTFGIDGRKRLIEQFQSLRPDIQLEMFAYSFSDEVIAGVLKGIFDFGIVYGPVHEPNLLASVIDIASATICLPKDDRLSTKALIEIDDLRGRRIAVGLQNANCARFQKIYGWLEPAGIEPVFVPEGRRFVFDAAKDAGLAVVAYSRADPIPDSFVRIPFNAPSPTLDICIIRHRARNLSSAGELLWRLSSKPSAKTDRLMSRGGVGR